MKYYTKAFLLLLFFISVNASSQKFDELALTPPMGWNSWGFFNSDISEEIVKQTADAMVETGMRDAGYEYLVIDDCWQTGRDSAGNILADAEKFPSGIKALAAYVHEKGLKLGIYSCAGTLTCQGRPGSRGYEFQDARQYAAWGVDFVKYDWCNVSTQDAEASYTLMRDAIYAAGRPMVFSICEWGLNKPWLWAKDVGHMWRTTGDIRDNWSIPDAKSGYTWGGGVMINFSMQKDLEEYAGPGHWNDPDYLVIGNGGLSPEESRAHFSLWSMLTAPLFATNDLRNMDAFTIEILTNREVISINQDKLGKQASCIKDIDYRIEVWKKELEDGVAVCIFNKSEETQTYAFSWKDFGIESKDYIVTDIWANKKAKIDLDETIEVKLKKHDVVLYRLK